MDDCRLKNYYWLVIQHYLLGGFDNFSLGSLIAIVARLLPSTGVNLLTVKLMM
jgi:hypothetical protein